MKAQPGFVSMPYHIHQSPLAPLWQRALYRVLQWRAQAYQRRLLASLSDEALKDIGLSRADIQAEIERPFWIDALKR